MKREKLILFYLHFSSTGTAPSARAATSRISHVPGPRLPERRRRCWQQRKTTRKVKSPSRPRPPLSECHRPHDTFSNYVRHQTGRVSRALAGSAIHLTQAGSPAPASCRCRTAHQRRHPATRSQTMGGLGPGHMFGGSKEVTTKPEPQRSQIPRVGKTGKAGGEGEWVSPQLFLEARPGQEISALHCSLGTAHHSEEPAVTLPRMSPGLVSLHPTQPHTNTPASQSMPALEGPGARLCGGSQGRRTGSRTARAPLDTDLAGGV